MAFSYTTDGATDRSSIIRGDIGFVSGTWRSKSFRSGTLVTGGGTVLAYDVSIGSAILPGTAQIGSATIQTNKNKGGDGNTHYGSIQFTGMNAPNETAGDWWAIVRV